MFFGKRFSGYRKGSLSGLDVLVLSIIKTNDGISGYDLIQQINEKFKDLWTASAGTIYPLLNRLEEKEFVSKKEITENNRQKHIYTMTEKGNEALKNVLESNLEPSMNTLGDYIRTVIGAIPIKQTMDEAFCCFPFQQMSHEDPIDEEDYSRQNIEKVEILLNRFLNMRNHLQGRLDKISKNVEYYEKILNKLKIERDRKAQQIPIVEDEEFEKF